MKVRKGKIEKECRLKVRKGKIEKECRLIDRYWKVHVNDYAFDI
jgi:hypothetical protein